MEYNEIEKILNASAISLVGILCKRIELFVTEEKKTKRIVLTPSLYKSIVKEHIYEENRNVKKLIYTIENGAVEFRRDKE